MSAPWKRVRAVFEEALQRDAGERAAFVDAACADAALRNRVHALLASHESDCGEFEPPDIDGGKQQPRDETPRWIGRRVDGYSIQRALGAGGMGVVYEAVQDQPHRTVAFKMLRQGLGTPDAARRFRFESEILGRLHHPNIAQIYDAGTWREDGGGLQPYFAMELVPDARNLIEHAEERDLDVEGRIRLFLDVCAAVQHGHEKGVIHRDLKPANVLVDPEGHPKVIDFGIARASDPDLATTSLLSEGGYVLGTLPYMAPEQVSGDPHAIDTRTDVYGLGAVLFELLCGQPPFDVGNAPLIDAALRLCEEDPVRPREIRPDLPQDLDWILLKALSKEAPRRYGSASEFAADLTRFLGSEPVLAGPPSRRYRLARFVRRHRVGVVAAGAVGMALVLGVTGLGYGLSKTSAALSRESAALDGERSAKQEALEESVRARDAEQVALSAVARADSEAQRAQRETQRARQEAETYERVARFLETLWRSADPRYARGKPPTVRELLDRGAEQIASDLEQDPLVRMRLMLVMGNAYQNLGTYDASRRLHAEAVRFGTEQLGAEHELTLAALNDLAAVEYLEGHLGEAEQLWVQVRDTHRRLAMGDHLGALETLSNLGAIYLDTGRLEAAQDVLDEALAGYRRLGDAGAEGEARMLNSLGVLHRYAGRLEEAEQHYRWALEAQRAVYGEDHPETFATLMNLASIRKNQERWADAETLCREALEGRRRVLDDGHADVLRSMSMLSLVIGKLGKWDEAIALSEQALAGLRQVFGEHGVKTLREKRNLAFLYEKQGRTAEAVSLYEEVVAGRDTLDEDTHDTLQACNSLGLLHERAGRVEEAEQLLRMAADGGRRVLGPDDPTAISMQHNLATSLRNQRLYAEAHTLYQDGLERRLRVLGPDHFDTLQSISDLASNHFFQGSLREAEPLILRELDGRRRTQGSDHPHTVTLLNNLAVLYKRLGRYACAEQYACELLERTPAGHADTERRRALLDSIVEQRAQLPETSRSRP